MRVTVLTIGDEIVGGHVVDTNAAYLSRRLSELGFRVRRLASVGDDLGEIGGEIKLATTDSDLLFVTGGLGPTRDDITKQAVAEAAGRPLVIDSGLHASLRHRFSSRAGVRPEVIESFSRIPEGARVLENPLGAAPGIAVEVGGKTVYLMPGVPREMRAVFERDIVAEIAVLSRTGLSKSRVIRTFGLRESEIAEQIEDVRLPSGVRLGYLPGRGGVDLRLVASGRDEPSAAAVLGEAAGALARVLGRSVYSTEGEDLQVVVGGMLIARATTIAVAESCTGGLVGHLLTEVPGISACFKSDIVAYSNRTKVDTLAIDEELIRRYGAVSRQVGEAMAIGARRLAGTHLGLSTTGIAGPTGGSRQKPVGLVYVCLAHQDGCIITDNVFRGTREIVKSRAAMHALDLVRCHLLDTGV
jgi:nicotinamide-nucleotide amidase